MACLIVALLLYLNPALDPNDEPDAPLSDILIEGEGWSHGQPMTASETRAMRRLRSTLGLVDLSGIAASPNGESFYACRESIPYIASARRGAPERALLTPRRKPGSENVGAAGLAVDRAGRIYAGTECGIQVFHPDGWLIGVLTPPAPGMPDYILFEGDVLRVWAGGVRYSRRLNAIGLDPWWEIAEEAKELKTH